MAGPGPPVVVACLLVANCFGWHAWSFPLSWSSRVRFCAWPWARRAPGRVRVLGRADEKQIAVPTVAAAAVAVAAAYGAMAGLVPTSS